IDRGADINARNKCGCTPLHLAIKTAPNIAYPSLKLLLENGADIDAQDRDGRTCLHIAAMRAEYPLMSQLLHLGANVDIADNDGKRPIHVLAELGLSDDYHWAFVELIRALWGVIDVHDTHIRTHLHYATRAGVRAPYIGNEWDNSRACAKLLVTSGAVIDKRDNELRTPLHYATRRGLGNIEIARYLMGRGASARGDRELPWAPICLAAIHGPLSMVRLLIDNGADIDHGQGIGNMAAIHAAAAVGYVSIVRLLVEHGARVNDVLDGGWTALHLAAMADHTIHVLLDAGADLNAETEEGWKPIDVALDRKIRRLLYQQ
ncbi:ankyrin repeat-containing domain protein, partial [Schizophyllum commune]